MIKDSKVLNFNVRNRFEKKLAHARLSISTLFSETNTNMFLSWKKIWLSWTTIKGITLTHLTIRAIESNGFQLLGIGLSSFYGKIRWLGTYSSDLYILFDQNSNNFFFLQCTNLKKKATCEKNNLCIRSELRNNKPFEVHL